jgi:SWI/SNF-related matrix-associated actin-dependent regulator of chromatin subfamily A-like protein 1
MQLFQHQKEGIEFLKKTKRAILADEMGLGKTRQAILALAETVARTKLVICPASLKINWKREIEIACPGSKVFVVESGKEREISNLYEWVVINYDMLPKYLEQLKRMIAEGEIAAAIADEAHYIKGKKTIRAKATLELLTALDRVYLLTGTPIMNRPIELFNMLVVVKHPLSKSRTLYGKKYCGAQLKCMVTDLALGRRFFVDPKSSFPFRQKPDRYRVMMWNDESGATHLDDLRQEIAPVFLRRTKKEVLDLPEKIISVEVCEIDRNWKRLYDTAWDSYLAWLERHPDAGKNLDNILQAQALVELMKLKQVCAQSKVDRIIADIENACDQEQKVIVFTQFTEIVQMLKSGLERKLNSPVKDVVTLTGADDMRARQIAVDAFQNDPDTKVIICNIKAGGVGLNLTAASVVMFADMEWSPEIHAQAEDRAHRIGQQGTVSVYYYVVKDTIEEDIVELLEQKKAIIRQVTDGKTATVEGKSIGAELLHRIRAKQG